MELHALSGVPGRPPLGVGSPPSGSSFVVSEFPDFKNALLIGTWVNVSLYSVNFVFGIYFLNAFATNRLQKVVVIFALLVDLVGTAGNCADLYVGLFTPLSFIPGSIFPIHYRWALPLAVMTNSTAAIIEQSFFIYRYWKLSGRKFISAFMGLLLLAHYILAIAVVISFSMLLPVGIKLTIATTTLCASTDILVACALSWFMLHFHNGPTLASTQRLIHRVCINAVSCGIVTAAATMVVLISSSRVNPSSVVVYLISSSMLGRIYTLMLLLNLILLRRAKLRAVMSTRALHPGVSIELRPLSFMGDSHSQSPPATVAQGLSSKHGVSIPVQHEHAQLHVNGDALNESDDRTSTFKGRNPNDYV